VTLVSVIIPTHNRTRLLLDRCLPSVQQQTHTELDIIVVGDATEQETVDAMVDVVAADPRVRFWNLPRQSLPGIPDGEWAVLGLQALNFGLDQALGEWETRVADDDAFTPDHVEALLAAVTGTNARAAYGQTAAHYPDGRSSLYGHWPPSGMNFTDNALCQTSLGYRYDPECVKRGLPEDADMWERMIRDGVQFVFVEKVLTHYYPNQR